MSICNSVLAFVRAGRTSLNFVLNSTLYFQSAAVVGRQNSISQPAQSPARWQQAATLNSENVHKCILNK